MVEALLVLAVLLLVALLVISLRRPHEEGAAELRRDLLEIRAAQEATKTEVARAHATGLDQVGGRLQTAVDQFHGRIGELTQGLTKGQGEAAETVRLGLEQARATLNAQIASLTTTLQQGLASSQEHLGTRLAETTKVVGDLRTQVSALEEAAKGMQALGKDIAELQNVLRAPKLRGNLGEVLLGELLAEILPTGTYETQHRFADGTAVDAAIRLRGQWVPVDAKFPLEAFNRMRSASDEGARAVARKEFATSVRGRIDEVATRYIRPAEETFDFALMYLPAEGIYYEVVVRDEDSGILAYALGKKVIPVSPNTLYAYLATIVMGLQGMRIEERAREIQRQVADLQARFVRFFEVFQGIGRNLDLAARKFEEASKKAEKVNDLMGAISGARAELPEVEPVAEIEPAPRAALPAEVPNERA
ncbi:MAG TPA: DNA recombination protein RmuC [Planctomycetota bacterium]|jgi:DNA recombination protein RmuC|nr:DNA recombination protein RmuC [Planctomycetota bacterium]